MITKKNNDIHSVALPVETELNDRYIIKNVLSKGGFSITYIAHDKILNMDTVVKEYMPKQMLEREKGTTEIIVKYDELMQNFAKGADNFLEEARILARFSGCEGIVSVIDYFPENNTAYIVMPYIEGITLSKYIFEHGTLSDDETINLLTLVISTLSKVHEEGIIHRDISPDNIFITQDSKAILLDFGICLPIEDESKEAVQNRPTSLKHGYAPPEQYCYKGIQGPWTDVYSMAATMHYCMTGESPKPAVERMHQAGYKLNITNHAVSIALSLMSKDRYQDMDAFLKALHQKPEKNKNKALKPVLIACAFAAAFAAGYLLKGSADIDVIGKQTIVYSEPTDEVNIDIKEDEIALDNITPNPMQTPDSTPNEESNGKEYELLVLSEDDIVPISDKNLVAGIREETNKPTGDILIKDIKEIRSLNMLAMDIEDLDGIQYFENLTWLDVGNNLISDVTPVIYLENLDLLRLHGNLVEDISPLNGCTSISQLDLASNYVVDISALSTLNNLTWLDLHSNNVKDISPIMHLPKLQWLNAGGNDIDDYSCLAELPRIEELSISGNNGTYAEAFDGHPTLVNFQP